MDQVYRGGNQETNIMTVSVKSSGAYMSTSRESKSLLYARPACVLACVSEPWMRVLETEHASSDAVLIVEDNEGG